MQWVSKKPSDGKKNLSVATTNVSCLLQIIHTWKVPLNEPYRWLRHLTLFYKTSFFDKKREKLHVSQSIFRVQWKAFACWKTFVQKIKNGWHVMRDMKFSTWYGGKSWSLVLEFCKEFKVVIIIVWSGEVLSGNPFLGAWRVLFVSYVSFWFAWRFFLFLWEHGMMKLIKISLEVNKLSMPQKCYLTYEFLLSWPFANPK